MKTLLSKWAAVPWLMWVGGIKFTLVFPLLQVYIGGVGRTSLWRSMYHQQTSSKTGTHYAKLIATLAGPHVWVPIYNLTLSLLIPTTWARIQMPSGARSLMAKDANPPMTVIPIGGVVGRIPKWLADSAHNRLNLIPAPSHSENALAHWLQLISVIHKKSCTCQLCNNRSNLAACAYQIAWHELSAQLQISQQIIDFLWMQDYRQAPSTKPNNCVWVIMKKNNSLGVFMKGTKINSLNKLCRQLHQYSGRLQDSGRLPSSFQGTTIQECNRHGYGNQEHCCSQR